MKMFMYWDFDLLCVISTRYLPGGRPASEAADNVAFFHEKGVNRNIAVDVPIVQGLLSDVLLVS